MFLFSRTITLSGSPRRTVPWALSMTEYVNRQTGLGATLWSGLFGQPLGTVSWTAVVESQAALSAATAGLASDDGYLDLVDQAEGLIAAPGMDQLGQIIHGEPTEEPAVGAVATVTTATAMFDRLPEAVAWGVEVAQYGATVIGSQIAVLTSAYGQMGEIAWITVQPDLDSAAAAAEKLAVDAGYLGRMPVTKELFIQGSGHVSQTTRIA